jgi:hypothetical protein
MEKSTYAKIALQGQGNRIKKRLKGRKKKDDNTSAKAKRRFKTIHRYFLH